MFDLDTNAWTQRGYRDEIALGFGLTKPLMVNQYGEHDLFSSMLTILIVHFHKISMPRAAGLVRAHWRETLHGLAVEEWGEGKGRSRYTESYCFVVATDADDPDKTDIRVAVGPCEWAINKVGTGNFVPFAMPFDLVLRKLRDLAEKAVVKLPQQFTPGLPTSAAYKRWIKDIEAYRQIALTRRGGKRKATA